MQVGGRQRADRPLCPNGHEGRSLDRAVGEDEPTGASGAAGGVEREFEHGSADVNAESGSRNAEQVLALPFRVPRSHFRVHVTAIASPYESNPYPSAIASRYAPITC